VSLHYLILCHRSNEQLLDLIKSIYRADDSYALHVDRKAPRPLALLGQNLAAKFPNISFVEQRNCSWGGYSLVAATLDAMGSALDASTDWTHFILLSEQHLPLLPVESLRACFEASVSYVQAQSVERMYPNGRADVMHRFARRYRELEGVGSFATQRQQPDSKWVSQLFHGSQWIVLSRAACSYLLDAANPRELWTPFEQSLLADETAIPTLIMRGVRQGILKAKDRNATFVAFPSAGGSDDMTFSNDNFFTARDSGYAFIRKRPTALPDNAQAAWQENLTLAPETIRAFEHCNDAAVAAGPGPSDDAARKDWTQRLMTLLRLMFPQLSSELIDQVDHAPKIYLRVRRTAWRPDVSVCLLSEDLTQFKVLILWSKPFDGSYDEILFSSFECPVIRARVYGMFGLREVVLGEKFNYGFVETPADMPYIAYMIGQHILACDDFDAQLRAQPDFQSVKAKC